MLRSVVALDGMPVENIMIITQRWADDRKHSRLPIQQQHDLQIFLPLELSYTYQYRCLPFRAALVVSHGERQRSWARGMAAMEG